MGSNQVTGKIKWIRYCEKDGRNMNRDSEDVCISMACADSNVLLPLMKYGRLFSFFLSRGKLNLLVVKLLLGE